MLGLPCHSPHKPHTADISGKVVSISTQIEEHVSFTSCRAFVVAFYVILNQ